MNLKCFGVIISFEQAWPQSEGSRHTDPGVKLLPEWSSGPHCHWPTSLAIFFIAVRFAHTTSVYLYGTAQYDTHGQGTMVDAQTEAQPSVLGIWISPFAVARNDPSSVSYIENILKSPQRQTKWGVVTSCRPMDAALVLDDLTTRKDHFLCVRVGRGTCTARCKCGKRAVIISLTSRQTMRLCAGTRNVTLSSKKTSMEGAFQPPL